MTRYAVYDQYRKYVRERDDRPVEEICSVDGDFALQVQQDFLKDYIRENPTWDKLILYHQIGSGKTCTAITIAEEFVKNNPGHKVTVVLPARLRTNFFDELVSPCGMDAYISRADFVLYNMADTSPAVKRKIRGKFMTAIAKRYEIISFEKFRGMAVKATNLTKWVDDFTKNRLIIVDEVHNLFGTYVEHTYATMVEKDKVQPKAKSVASMLMRYMTKNADPSCKMVLLTATPIFDNIMQFRELVRAVAPGTPFPKDMRLSDMVNLLRGKVSFFPGTSANAYPTVEYVVHNVPMSKTLDHLMRNIIDGGDDDDNEIKEAFMAKQRQASITCFPYDVPRAMTNLGEYAPKIKELAAAIEQGVGKHIVYSSFVVTGINLTRAALEARGWINVMRVIKDPKLWEDHAYKVYAVWDGSTKDNDKQLIKGIVNRRDNMDGRHVRVILGSPSMKEGVSFKHMQHLHLLDPLWNQSAKTQVEGRAIRFCSHVDIPADHPTLAKRVNVHIYKITKMPRGGTVSETCDEYIYDTVIPKKQELIAAAETAMKKVAIDHYLFRNMYAAARHQSPQKASQASPISIENDVQIRKKQKAAKVKTSTCPKPRQPNDEGMCAPGYVLQKNKEGDDCCYKASKANVNAGETAKPAAATKCPKDRLPVDGKCPEGFKLKKNKTGVDCCYKVRGA